MYLKLGFLLLTRFSLTTFHKFSPRFSLSSYSLINQFFPPTSSPTLSGRQQVGWPPNETTDSVESEGWWSQGLAARSNDVLLFTEPESLASMCQVTGMATRPVWHQQKQGNRTCWTFILKPSPTQTHLQQPHYPAQFATVTSFQHVSWSAHLKKEHIARDDLEVPFSLYPPMILLWFAFVLDWILTCLLPTLHWARGKNLEILEIWCRTVFCLLKRHLRARDYKAYPMSSIEYTLKSKPPYK